MDILFGGQVCRRTQVRGSFEIRPINQLGEAVIMAGFAFFFLFFFLFFCLVVVALSFFFFFFSCDFFFSFLLMGGPFVPVFAGIYGAHVRFVSAMVCKYLRLRREIEGKSDVRCV